MMTIAFSAMHMLLELLEPVPHGMAVDELNAAFCQRTQDSFGDAVGQAIASGRIEYSPLYPGRLRWARSTGQNGAAAWVRLRGHARPLLADIHRHSGLPATLHVIHGRAHAVIERWPGDPAETIIEEVARYATPRPLASGNTGKVLLAWLPGTLAEASLVNDAERSQIRCDGYSYTIASQAALGCVITAPVCDAAGTPIAALCSYGAVEILPPERAPAVGREMAAAAKRLATLAELDWPLLRRPALALGGN